MVVDLNAEISNVKAAELLGISKQRVDQLISEGWIRRTPGGRQTLRGVVKGYLRMKEAELERRLTSVAKTDKERAQTRAIEVRTARELRELITMEAASAVVSELTAHFTWGLDQLPSRLTRDPDERRKIVEITDQLRRDLAGKAHEKIKELGVEETAHG